MKHPLIALMLAMLFSIPAHADYSFELIIPPDAGNANLFGINNAGKVVGGAFDDEFQQFLYGFEYDMKRGVYTTLGDDFDVVEINNPGMMVGSSFPGGECTIREKDGNFTTFFPPSYTPDSFCTGRGVNSNGKISGFVVDEFDVWTGFIYDSKHGTYEEFLASPQTIAHGINAQGQNVGSVFLFPDEAYPGSPQGRYAYLREANGSVKYFAIDQSEPGQSRARGISENGLISGFYVNPDTFEFTSFVTTLTDSDEFESIVLTDEEVVHLRPCDPDLPPPPEGYVILTDVFVSQVRNDGVVVGQCTDYHFDSTTFDFIPFTTYGLIATPIK